MRSPDLAVVEQIMQCYQSEALEAYNQLLAVNKIPKPDFYPIYWISKIIFRDFLLEQHFVDIPHPVILQKFEPVVEKMVKFGFLLRFFAGNHTDICVFLHFPNKVSMSSVYFYFNLTSIDTFVVPEVLRRTN